MKLLELFKGTGSVGKVFKEIYPDNEIVSLDILKKYEPTHCCDILNWDYKQYPVGYFDIIWASPECKVFSPLAFTNIGENRKYKTKQDLLNTQQEHSKYVLKALEIIEYFQPHWYFIENPFNSQIKNYVPKELPFYRFDYCTFGYDYKKPTKIWTNRQDLENRLCQFHGKHNKTIGWDTGNPVGRNVKNINVRYSIPPTLIEYLLT